MTFSHRRTTGLLVGLVFFLNASGVVAQPAIPGLDCSATTCSIELAPGLAIEAPPGSFFPHPDRLGFDLIGDASIPTPGQPVALAEAQLSFRLLPGGGVERLSGLVRMPIPELGFLDRMEISRQPMAAMGFDLGENLRWLGAPLRDGVHYYYFHLEAGFEASVGQISMSTPGGKGTVVLDPRDPFFYVDGEMEGLGGGDGKRQDGDGSSTDGSRTHAEGTASTNAPGPAREGGSGSDGTGEVVGATVGAAGSLLAGKALAEAIERNKASRDAENGNAAEEADAQTAEPSEPAPGTGRRDAVTARGELRAGETPESVGAMTPPPADGSQPPADTAEQREASPLDDPNHQEIALYGVGVAAGTIGGVAAGGAVQDSFQEQVDPSGGPQEGSQGPPAETAEATQARTARAETDGASETAGEDRSASLGFGFSAGGFIPFDPVSTVGVESVLTGFDGQLYLRAPFGIPGVPLELDGTTVFDLDPDEDGDHPFDPEAFAASPDLEYGGNGVLSVGIPFLQFFSFGFELGNASMGVSISEDRVRAAFSGEVNSDQLLPDLPIPIRPTGEVIGWGVLSDDVFSSFIHLEGEMGIDASVLGELSGVPLAELDSYGAMLDVNASGLHLVGETTKQIHPDIAYTTIELEVFVSPDGSGSFVLLRGDVVVAGEGLEDAEIKISDQGVFVNGLFRTELNEFRMDGALLGSGYWITGSATVADPMEVNAQEQIAALDDLLQNEENVARIEQDLAAARSALDGAASAAAAARSAVDAAQAEVNRLQGQINGYARSASSNYGSYKSWKKKKCKWYQASCKAKRASRMSYYYGRYGYYNGLKAGVVAAKKVADATLGAARSTAAPLETALSNAGSAVSLLESRLDEAIAGVSLARQRLEAVPDLEGSLEPIVSVTLQNGEVTAGVVATWNGRTLTDGTVDLGGPGRAGEVCIHVPAGPGHVMCSPL